MSRAKEISTPAAKTEAVGERTEKGLENMLPELENRWRETVNKYIAGQNHGGDKYPAAEVAAEKDEANRKLLHRLIFYRSVLRGISDF